MRHAALVVLAMAGCGEVVGDKTPDAATIDAALIDGAPDVAAVVHCDDTFDDAMIDPALWVFSDANNTPIVLSETGGRLRSTVPNTPTSMSAGTNLLLSRRPFTFAGATIQLQVIALPVDQETQSMFFIGDAMTNVGFQLYSTTPFHAEVGASGVFVPTSDRFWRVREAAGTTYIESSADGTTWTTRHMGATPAMTNPQIKIGSFLDTGPGGIYEVDNLVMTFASGACPLHVSTD